VRALSLGEINEAEAHALGGMLASAARHWHLVDLSRDICAAAERRFPIEPVRSLDALHLSTALHLYGELGSISLLTTDERLVRNALLLGLPLAL
jgi:hypothetical protein